MHPEELLKNCCPVCRRPCCEVTIFRIEEKTRGHTAGGAPKPIQTVTRGIRLGEQFKCNFYRSRTLLDGRWSQWEFMEANTCTNAQSVALMLRESETLMQKRKEIEDAGKTSG